MVLIGSTTKSLAKAAKQMRRGEIVHRAHAVLAEFARLDASAWYSTWVTMSTCRGAEFSQTGQERNHASASARNGVATRGLKEARGGSDGTYPLCKRAG